MVRYLEFGFLLVSLEANSQKNQFHDKNIKVELMLKSNSKKSDLAGQVYFKVFLRNEKEYIEALPESPLDLNL